jgi:subtilisin family serine protease/subtilisin-like proprotein convertase family protein
MRSRPLTWLQLSVMLFLTGACVWWLGSQWAAGRMAALSPQFRPSSHVSLAPRITSPSPLELLSGATPSNASPLPPLVTHQASRFTHPFPLRLRNTPKPLSQLVRSPAAILLENALIDTAQPIALSIPEHLRSHGDPGAYVIQSRAPLDDAFRTHLSAAGASIVAYIPNQAYLVRASKAAAQQLQAEPQTQVVLPYEPYFKLEPPLLALAVEQQPLPKNQALNLLLFPDARVAALDELNRLGVQVLGEERSPFGPVLKVLTESAAVPAGQSSPVDQAGILPALAGLASVQEVEISHARVLANDLSRARIAVAANTVTPDNYLGLTGSNIFVNVNDSGVDATHPDLQGRVFCDVPISGVDSNGHGTHVAGIIAGSGFESLTVTDASGSIMPAVRLQFRGQAPAAQVFAIVANSDPAPASDTYLQETAARTNAFISNNSWHYANDNAYDLAAARYDAAVRDALPEVSGSQPMLFVFGAGNTGNGADNGSGGDPDSVQSPATAKNVITVGACEQPRHIADQAWQCAIVNGTNVCQTNQPWLGLTETNNAVAAFSSRGNVGVGIEGDFGRFKPDIVAPGTFVISARSAQWNQLAYYNPTNDSGNYFEVFSNLNNTLGPFYRFESGTSLSAAEVSGALALMQEFFLRLGRTNSPALMKALLINGARPLTTGGAFQIQNSTNSQGWGLINLTNSLPVGLSNSFIQAPGPMQVFDQNALDALATGQSHTRFVSLSPSANNQPLRFTLVWTDPPGNPAASLKLVNNLDLLVTNLDSGEVFFGNDIPPGSSFNSPWDTNTPPNLDVVDNVENVYLPPPLASNYSVTVVARSVNVSAVTGQTHAVLQDYALVIAAGDGQIADALTVTDAPVVSVVSPRVTFITNSFSTDQGISGGLLLNQRAGAQGPLPDGNTIPWPGGTNGAITVGLANQWHFYVLTNDQDYTNAAFLTFHPVNLSLPRLGVNQTNVTNATRDESDIDLYVSTDPGLTNLDPAVLAAADKALDRRGTGMVVYSNAAPGALYYVGVKAEDQEAAEYSLMGVFSLLPFGEQDETGSWILRGINVPALIPDGTAARPGVTNVVAIAPAPIPIRRVVVTNELWHQSFPDLVGTLSHGRKSVVLNHNSLPPVDPVPSEYTYIYEDNGEGGIPGSQPTDGPGSLRDFIGEQGMGVWLLTMTDNALTHTGLLESFTIRLEPQNVANAALRDVFTNAFSFDFLDVPIGATNLTVCLYNNSATPLPVGLYLRRGDLPTLTTYDQMLSVNPPSGCLSISLSTLPPLNPGRYYIGVFNSNGIPQTIGLGTEVDLDPSGVAPVTYASAGPTPILDDAVTTTSLFVSNHQAIASLDVGLLVSHPRVSDLVFTLVSPSGTRVLLFEDRGGATTNGLGGIVPRTSIFPTRTSGNYLADTNILNVGANQGTLFVDYDFYMLPDTMHVYYDGVLIYDSGLVSSTNDVTIPFGPGLSTNLVIIMDERNNSDTNTLWEYTATVVCPGPAYLVFTENTNLAPIPIKFASPPFLPAGGSFDLYCLPEQSLNTLVGESAFGLWQLEMWDTRAGAAYPAPELASWQLRFVFQNTVPVPIGLTHGITGTNTIPPGQTASFFIDVPAWATLTTNILVNASAPVNLLFNQNFPLTGTNSGDITLLSATTGGFLALTTNGTPPLIPGARYYLGIQNPGTASVTAAVQVDFDVTPLANGVLFNATHAGNTLPRCFSYDVSSNATAASFQLLNLSGNLDLVARTTPFPTLASYDYGSFNRGTNDEDILIFNTSSPVALAPGRWYLGVFNADPTNVTYTILATEYTNAFPNIITLTSGVPYFTANSGAGYDTDYYQYVVTTNAVRAQFEIDGPTGDVTLVARKGLPLPTLTNFTLLSANPSLNEEMITLFNFSTPVALTPGDWFISAVNVSGGPLAYTMMATEFSDYGTNVLITISQAFTNSFCLTWTSVPGIHYYVQGKTSLDDTNWVAVSPTLVAADVLTACCVPLPSPWSFFRVAEGLAIAPYVPPFRIANIICDTNGVRLQWLAPSNSHFQAQWTPSVAPPAWTSFTNILTSTNGVFSFRDDGSETAGPAAPRYYRLLQLPSAP